MFQCKQLGIILEIVRGTTNLNLDFGSANADRWLSGQKQQAVNLPALAVYGGSNPPLSTRRWKSETRKSKLAKTAWVGIRISSFYIRVSKQRAGVTQW